MNHGDQKSLRIAIATLGRFHVLDLARELDALGHHVRFYSYVPRKRAAKFGLPERCHVALLPFLAPVMLLTKIMSLSGLRDMGDNIMHLAADRLVSRLLEPCDVFIGMSGVYVKAFKAANHRYGAKRVVERGSVHIETQRDILEKLSTLNPEVHRVPKSAVGRELDGYALAERISVPSMHAEESFIAHGMSRHKLFRNPYGIDLEMFKSDPQVQRDSKLILFVGAWSYQKGVDILLEAMSTLSLEGYRLRHVGAVGDAPLSRMACFESIGQVDQSQLAEYYCAAGCLVLPSRQDGFALVQLQALACNCPVIGSSMSGARDLVKIIGGNDLVQVVPVGDVQALIDAVRVVRQIVARDATDVFDRDALSGRAYAVRYESMLLSLAESDGPASDNLSCL